MPRIVNDPAPALLAAVDAQCFAEPMDAAAFADWHRHPVLQSWLLLGDDDAPAGLLCFQRVADEAEVHRLGVARSHRRRGLARWLLGRFLADVRAAGVARVHLEVRASNAAAQALYTQAGFRESGRRPRYYTAPVEDAVRFAWEA